MTYLILAVIGLAIAVASLVVYFNRDHIELIMAARSYVFWSKEGDS